MTKVAKLAPPPRFRISTFPAGGLVRRNDGSLLVLEGGGDEVRIALTVPPIIQVERGQGATIVDPDQEAFARHVVGLMNKEPPPCS